jgi:hypothetical protein
LSCYWARRRSAFCDDVDQAAGRAITVNCRRTAYDLDAFDHRRIDDPEVFSRIEDRILLHTIDEDDWFASTQCLPVGAHRLIAHGKTRHELAESGSQVVIAQANLVLDLFPGDHGNGAGQRR